MSLQVLLRLGDELPVPEHDPEDVRQMADEILSRPEYRESSDSFLDQVNDTVTDLIEELLQGIGMGGSSIGPAVAWLLLLLLVGLIAAIVVWAVRAGAFGRVQATGEGEPVIVATDVHRSAHDWLSEAERHEAEGRWREGLLCRYRSLVVALVEREIIPEQAGRTAGEYVRDVRHHHPEGAPSFAAATELFEAAWYGHATTGPEERDRFMDLAAQVQRPREIGVTR